MCKKRLLMISLIACIGISSTFFIGCGNAKEKAEKEKIEQEQKEKQQKEKDAKAKEDAIKKEKDAILNMPNFIKKKISNEKSSKQQYEVTVDKVLTPEEVELVARKIGNDLKKENINGAILKYVYNATGDDMKNIPNISSDSSINAVIGAKEQDKANEKAKTDDVTEKKPTSVKKTVALVDWIISDAKLETDKDDKKKLTGTDYFVIKVVDKDNLKEFIKKGSDIF